MTDRFAHPKISGFGQSVFSEMSQLAREADAINLGQGFPDFPGPEFVKDAAISAIRANRNQYAVSYGEPALRMAVARAWRGGIGQDIDPDTEVTVTSGATEALYGAIQAFAGPGDEVIALEPFYDSYPAAVRLAGADFVPVRMTPPAWQLPVDAIRAAITRGTRVIILNTPHNPTGRVFTRLELESLSELAIEHDLLVLTDEVYDRILFGDARHVSMASLPGMWDRTLTVGSTGKTFSMTGWKIGYAIGPDYLNRSLRAVHQFVTFATATPFQVAMADALTMSEQSGYYETLRNEYAGRKRILSDAMTAAGLEPLTIQGSYFLTADVSSFGFESDMAFCRWLVKVAGVAAVPPSAFYLRPASAPMMARFCFAKSHETLQEAGRRLAQMPNAGSASVAAQGALE